MKALRTPFGRWGFPVRGTNTALWLTSVAPAFLALALVVGVSADSWLKNHQAATTFLEIGYTSRLLRKD